MIAFWIVSIIAILTAGYSYYMHRKNRKRQQQQKVSQIDGSIADEGTSFSDIAGTYPIYGVIVDKYGERTEEIRQKMKKK